MNAPFRFLALGVGNAFTRRFFNASLLLDLGGTLVGIDCPAPYRRVLYEAERSTGTALDVDAIDHLILTHLHADHCSGLEEYAYWRRIGPAGAPGSLYILPENVEPLWKHKLYAALGREGRSLDDFFHVHAWDENAAHRLSVPGVDATFRIRRTRHSVPTMALLIETPRGTFGYSADTPFDEELIAFLSPADVIVHETGPVGAHTPIETLLALPDDLRSKMWLIHAPDDYHARDVGMRLLEEGRWHVVGR